MAVHQETPEMAKAALRAAPRPRRRASSKSSIYGYVFVVPFFAVFAIFMLYPIIYSLVLSFNRWTAGEMTFVGWANYSHLLNDSLFWRSLMNTGIFLVVQVPSMVLLATIVAALLKSNTSRFTPALRVAFFLPALIDLVTYSIVFSLMFNENNGIINSLITWIGLDPVPWRSDALWAKVMIIIAITWRWTGYNAIIVLSGMQNIPDELYEAAALDGVGVIKKFVYITVPMLKPILLFCTMLSTIGTLQLFAEPLILTGGGPNHGTSTVMLYLYDTAFSSFNFGLASAGAYVVTTIIALLSYLQIRVSRGGEI